MMHRRTVVKVCGLTHADDAAWALGCGADWLGFIVNGESPRRIEPEQAAAIVQAAGGGVPVAVMAGVTPEEALELARRARAERVQLHRVSSAGWPADFPLPCAFALGVTAEGAVVGEEPGREHLLLLDTHSAEQAGGTGRTWPWKSARPLAARRDVLLAGGLSGDNVGEAIRIVRPFGVDASSALESRPGRKDRERVRRYVEAARAAERLLEDAS